MLRNFHDIRAGVAGTLLVLLLAGGAAGGCADRDQLSEQGRPRWAAGAGALADPGRSGLRENLGVLHLLSEEYSLNHCI